MEKSFASTERYGWDLDEHVRKTYFGQCRSVPKNIKHNRPRGEGDLRTLHTCIYFTCALGLLLAFCTFRLFSHDLGGRDVQNACLARITKSREK